jgi:hypothetical protein
MSEKEEKTASQPAGQTEQTWDKKDEFLFIQFISGLYTSTMQHLGKLMNPATGEIEKNLDAAQATIELLRMLKEKTKGSLSKRESDTISNALANMQMNYVDELKRTEETAKKDESQKEKVENEQEQKETGNKENGPKQ